MINIHFQRDDDGPAATVADLEAALWQIAEWLPDENGRHGSKNTWAKERLRVTKLDGKTFITMPGDEGNNPVVWRLEEVVG